MGIHPFASHPRLADPRKRFGVLRQGHAPTGPVIDLLKSYFQIEDRDDERRIREKVTGKLLTLDEALKPHLVPLLALLDVASRR